MDAIKEAHDGMKLWEETDCAIAEAKWIAYTMANAAIAQAEQLKRIADMMEEDRRIAKVDSDARAYAAQVKYGR